MTDPIPTVDEKLPKKLTAAPFYPMYYLGLAETCREHGYALTVHGSMARDLDLVAIPWTDKACDEKTLIQALLKDRDLMEGNNTSENKIKPWGRKSYVFVFFGDARTGYIDLSVMPRTITAD